MLISRMDVSGKPSFSLSIFTFFSATMRPFALSLALMAQRLNRKSKSYCGKPKAEYSQGMPLDAITAHASTGFCNFAL